MNAFKGFFTTWMKIWLAFCILLSITIVTVIVWAIVKLVNHFT